MKIVALTVTAVIALLLALPLAARQDPTEKPKSFEAFELADLEKLRVERKQAYLPFLRRKALSTGIYHLKAGSRDGQSPHSIDEVYYVLGGVAKFTAGEETRVVKEGSILYVAAKESHRFHDIEEDLTLLVFFSNAPVEEAGGGEEDDEEDDGR